MVSVSVLWGRVFKISQRKDKIMRAIHTTYYPATTHRAGRYKAVVEGIKPFFLSRHDERVERLEHAEAQGVVAELLAEKLEWLNAGNYLIGGALKDGYVWVFSDSELLPNKTIEGGPAS